MPKAVLLSIQPKWCEKIASGEKTVEIRKTKPKLETPFKCYIYCTLSGSNEFFHESLQGDVARWNRGQWADRKANVIGEFTCDKISIIRPKSITCDNPIKKASCLTVQELIDYADTRDEHVYAWHISDLKIYRKPKLLKRFRNSCAEYEKDDPKCGNCDYYHSMGEYPAECACEGLKPMLRPPQSWCYVEEAKQ